MNYSVPEISAEFRNDLIDFHAFAAKCSTNERLLDSSLANIELRIFNKVSLAQRHQQMIARPFSIAIGISHSIALGKQKREQKIVPNANSLLRLATAPFKYARFKSHIAAAAVGRSKNKFTGWILLKTQRRIVH